MLARFSFAFVAAAALLATAPVSAQQVISAHSGVIQYVEGDVALDGQPVHLKAAMFPDVKNGQALSTGEGRAEVLLTPGVFLRLAEDSSFEMVSNRLADTKIKILTGTAMIEVAELLPDNAITLVQGDAEVALVKKGLYRADAETGMLRVYEGEARVNLGSESVVAKKGREVKLEGSPVARSFDTKDTDSFYRWSARRDAYVAQANNAAANSYMSGYQPGSSSPYGLGFGSGFGTGNWAWNPYFGMFTFFPSSGQYFSPFGYGFYNPIIIVRNYGYGSYVGNGRGFGSAGGLGTPSSPANSSFGTQPSLVSGGQVGGSAPQPVGHANPGVSSGGGMRSGGLGGGGLGGGGAAPSGRPAGGASHR